MRSFGFPYGRLAAVAAMMPPVMATMVLAALLATPVPASALCMHKERANLRSGPGTSHGKTWEVYRYMPLRETGSRGGWYHVEDLDGETHWILGSLATSKFRCAVVKGEEAKIRTGPGTDHPELAYSPLLRYATFKVLGELGGWVEVEDSFGDKGWIYRPLLWIQ
jgi:SH3-like domain-containing protein